MRAFRQVAAIAMAGIGTLASLASSPNCDTVSVDDGDSTMLSLAQPTAERRYVVVSERDSTAKANITVRSEQGATVRAALVRDGAAPPPTDPGAEIVLTVAATSEESADIERAACGEDGCTVAFTLELELVEGSGATVEWQALAESEQCSDSHHYIEIRRD